MEIKAFLKKSSTLFTLKKYAKCLTLQNLLFREFHFLMMTHDKEWTRLLRYNNTTRAEGRLWN